MRSLTNIGQLSHARI